MLPPDSALVAMLGPPRGPKTSIPTDGAVSRKPGSFPEASCELRAHVKSITRFQEERGHYTANATERNEKATETSRLDQNRNTCQDCHKGDVCAGPEHDPRPSGVLPAQPLTRRQPLAAWLWMYSLATCFGGHQAQKRMIIHSRK
ncbi:hypothetical protein NDU88_007008 [Pleurodeles waltl]|uniref:Uncharacterized protein n=1 Tax=Pleurodeles waltl TaxID=8319 RepID=A0AAV7M1Q2_PLEWA|nr:hypothetical protein NDU88_007008 [Pleurodeles waltl]